MDDTDQTGHSGRILVVDDGKPIQNYLTKVLSVAGYQVTCAFSGDQAVRFIGESRFNLIITDVVMPGRLNGLDVLRTARHADPECKVIVITGYHTAETAARALEEGAEDYIQKPLTPDLIRATVAKAMKSKRAHSAAHDA